MPNNGFIFYCRHCKLQLHYRQSHCLVLVCNPSMRVDAVMQKFEILLNRLCSLIRASTVLNSFKSVPLKEILRVKTKVYFLK